MTLKYMYFVPVLYLMLNESVLWNQHKQTEKGKGHAVLACHARAHLRLQQQK